MNEEADLDAVKVLPHQVANGERIAAHHLSQLLSRRRPEMNWSEIPWCVDKQGAPNENTFFCGTSCCTPLVRGWFRSTAGIGDEANSFCERPVLKEFNKNVAISTQNPGQMSEKGEHRQRLSDEGVRMEIKQSLQSPHLETIQEDCFGHCEGPFLFMKDLEEV